jgi:hypothetical protein
LENFPEASYFSAWLANHGSFHSRSGAYIQNCKLRQVESSEQIAPGITRGYSEFKLPATFNLIHKKFKKGLSKKRLILLKLNICTVFIEN